MFRATFLNYDYFLDYTKAAYAHTTSSTLPTRTQPVYNYLVEIYQYLTVSELDNLKHYKTPFIHYKTVVILMRVRVNRTCQNSSVARHLKVGGQSKIEANVPTKYS